MTIQTFIISRDDDIYEAWPDVALTTAGRLVCVFAECSHHIDRSYTRLVYKTSDDRGRNWSEKLALTEGTNGRPYWNCPRVSRLSNGKLVIVADHISGERETNSRVYMWMGNEDGTEWTGPLETPVTGIVPDKLCELPSGRWLLTAHERSTVTGYLEQWLWFSDDRGATWSERILLAGQQGLNLCEASILPLSDGTLVTYMRENSGQGWDAFKCISLDQGATWSPPGHAPIPGCHRPVAGLLQSGKVLVTYRFHQGGKGWVGFWTQNFFAALTDQDSARATERKEQWSRIMPIDYDRSPVSDLGYSGWVQFDDGEIYIVNYIMDDSPKGQIRGYSLRERDFLLE